MVLEKAQSASLSAAVMLEGHFWPTCMHSKRSCDLPGCLL